MAKNTQPTVCCSRLISSHNSDDSCRETRECRLPPTPTRRACLWTLKESVIGPTLSLIVSATVAPVGFSKLFILVGTHLRPQVSPLPAAPASCTLRLTAGSTISPTMGPPTQPVVKLSAVLVSAIVSPSTVVLLVFCGSVLPCRQFPSSENLTIP